MIGKRIWKTLGLAAALATAAVHCSFAGTISLNTTVKTTVQGEKLRVSITVLNRGDKSAYNGQAEIAVLGQRIMTGKADELPVGKPITFSKEVDLDPKMSGSYPLIVKVLYSDANQYPFTALASHVFSHGSGATSSDVVGQIAPVKLSDKAKIVLSLKNLSDAEMVLSTRLECPRELTTDTGAMEVVLPARTERTLRFSLANFSAMSGSTYPIVAVSEFDRAGVHNTTMTPGMISVIEKKKVLGLTYPVLAGVLVLLVVAFIAFEKRKK